MKLEYRFELEPALCINANKESQGMNPKCMSKSRYGIWGAFLSMKQKLQEQANAWIDENKPEPFGCPVKETFWVGNLRPSMNYDPVNYHPIEKVVTDVFVKRGILIDDHSLLIPEVTFRGLEKISRKKYEFVIQFEPFEN